MEEMIRRPPTYRALGAVLALWLTVFQTEPAAFHACAMHSGNGAAEAVTPAAHSGHAQHAAAATGHAPAAPHDSGASCTCPGGCSAASTVAIPEAGAEFTVEVAAPAGRPSSAIVSVQPAAADFVLPFANGPPTV